MSNYIIHREDEDYLEHFGVRGMHWGVRRYQNEDGSYKPGAEGRYADDGKPGVNTGHTVKNRVKSALGIYKEDDGNPYVSEKRRKIRKTEHDSFEEAEKKANKKKSEGEEEDEEISRRADALQKKNPNMSRKDAESAAEDEMIKEASEERKKQGKYGLLDKLSDKIGEAADRKEEAKAAKEAEKKRKQEEKTKYWQEQFKLAEQEEAARKEKKAAEKQAKEEAKAAKEAEKEKEKNKKLAKDSYMKVAGRYILRDLAGTGATLGAWALSKGNEKVTRAVGTASSMYNVGKTAKEAYDLHQYRKKNSAKHFDHSEYDYELYHHGILGMHWGIRRFQNEDGTLTAAGKKRYRTDEDVNKYGKTRKEVIDRLNKGAEKLASKSDEYYDKSQYSKEEKAFKRMQAQKAYENRDDENYKNKDDFSSYKSKLKEFDVYDEDNDKDYQMSKKLSDKANELAVDAGRLGKDYVRNNKIMGTTLAALAGGYAGYKIADAKGLSGKKFVASMLASSIASAAVANVATGKLSERAQNKTEKKYGFR